MKIISNLIQKMESKYNELDGAHDFKHIVQVTNNALLLNKECGGPYDNDIIIISALYHDIGNTVNRENHHIESARIVMEDKDLQSVYSYDTRYMISKACEEHRSSYNGPFTSLLSKIINDADSMAGGDTIEAMIERSLMYTKSKNPKDTSDMIYTKVYNHLVEKFGRYGYQKYKLNITNKLCNVEEIYKILDDENLFKIKYESVVKGLAI